MTASDPLHARLSAIAPLRQLIVYLLLALVTLGLGLAGVAYNMGYVIQESRAAGSDQYWTQFWDLVCTGDFVVGMLLSIFPVFFGLAILVLCWIEIRERAALKRSEA